MGCPLCRHTLDKSLPMIPNIAIDNTVEKHVKVLAISGATEWETEGRKYKEWTARKKWVFGNFIHTNLISEDIPTKGMATGSSETRNEEET